MGRELHILWAGRHRRGSWEALCADYRKRIERWVPVVDRPVKVLDRGDERARRKSEGEALLAAAPEPCWIFALDSRGKTSSSEAFSSELARLKAEWPHPVVFLLGSDLGLDPAVLNSARKTLSFSPMTFGHELARVILYEQLYRALSIEAGINYHRADL